MSQSLRSLNRVANLSGPPGHVLRPLSALRLKETVVERDGLVDPGAPARPRGALAPAPVRPGRALGDRGLPDAGRGLPAHRPGLLPPAQGPPRERPRAGRARPGTPQGRPAVPHPRGGQGGRRAQRRGQPRAHRAARPRRPAAAHRRASPDRWLILSGARTTPISRSPPASAPATATEAHGRVRIVVESDCRRAGAAHRPDRAGGTGADAGLPAVNSSPADGDRRAGERASFEVRLDPPREREDSILDSPRGGVHHSKDAEIFLA